MAHILMIGGTRFIGRAIADQLLAAGHRLTRFHRGQTGADLTGDHILGDRDALRDHREALRATAPDCIVHCIANTQAHAADLLAVFEGIHTRIVALSSMDVYAMFGDVLAERDRGEFPVDETSPLNPERFYLRALPVPNVDTYDKNLMTDGLMRGGRDGVCRPTVLRLPMVYGPGDHQFPGRHGPVIHHVLDRRARYIVGAVQQSEIWTFGYVDNIAAAVVHAAFDDRTVGQIYNVGEARQRTKRRWAELFAEAAGHSLELGLVPDPWIDPEAPAGGQAAHMLVSSARFRAETDFVDPVSREEAVARTLAWAADHRDLIGPTPDYAAHEAVWARVEALGRQIVAPEPS